MRLVYVSSSNAEAEMGGGGGGGWGGGVGHGVHIGVDMMLSYDVEMGECEWKDCTIELGGGI